ncbi:hypothetical protein E2C06_35795 [Dankookia rubra]|uniref:Uncharacterized protein n=1 Tax=Dankookia rubra TaxID=1442381 RepID=A0A4R5Q5K3_9PROT|nr:hypothetical protein E2C06_35795 [Dankookia rubra]
MCRRFSLNHGSRLSRDTRVRRSDGGRKSAVTLQPELPGALEELIEDAIRGDPETPLRWVSRSQRQIARVPGERGFAVSQKLVWVCPVSVAFPQEAWFRRRGARGGGEGRSCCVQRSGVSAFSACPPDPRFVRCSMCW